MNKIAHLSDLHFGKTSPKVVDALHDDLERLKPDLIVITGDFTQRAKHDQFKAARAFVDSLSAPVLAVPGNHDLMPLYRPISRLIRPQVRFNRHLGHVDRMYLSDDLLVMGMDSTNHLRWQNGTVTASDLAELDSYIAQGFDSKIKVAFLHHPPEIGSARTGYHEFVVRGIDLVLTGHVHKAHVSLITDPNGSAVLVQASTACSTRLRGHANGYAVIDVDPLNIKVSMHGWDGHCFSPSAPQTFKKAGSFWHPDP